MAIRRSATGRPRTRPKSAPRTRAKTRPRPRAATARPPIQARGQRRFDALLDAAEHIIAEVGLEGATTNAIAARAGAGMGSLYHLFASKDAIIAALGERFVQKMQPLSQSTLRPDLKDLSPAKMADAIFDPLAEFFRLHPAYIHVFRAKDNPCACEHCDGGVQDSVVQRVEALMLARAPHVAPALRQVQAAVAVELVHSVLGLAFTGPASLRRQVVDEGKRLLALYTEMIETSDDPMQRLG